MLSDFQYAFRSLAKSPGFSIAAILTLALGIGLSTTIFNGVNPLLFRPLPFRDPDTLAFLQERNASQGRDHMNVAYADFVHWRDENRVFSDIGVWDTTNFTLGEGEQPERIEGCQLSASLFSMLGLNPSLGRGFAAGEDQPGATPVVLLSDGLWERRFGADPAVVGRTIQLNGRAHTVIGIMPPRVRFPNDAELWVPLIIAEPEKTHGMFSWRVAARLRPGMTLAQAQADLDGIGARIATETPQTNAHVTPLVRPIDDGFLDRDLRAMGWTMLGAVAFVLAVACANVASLFLTRAVARHREFAIRLALGAGRWRTIRQLLAESLLLGSVAGVLGLLCSLWGLELVLRLVPVEIPYWIDFSLDARVLVFAVGISLVASIAFGLAPAWQASRVDVQTALTETARGSSGGRQRHRLRSALVIAEVALATLLLCGTGLMIRSLLNLQRIDPGFNPEQLASFYLDLGSNPTLASEARSPFLATFTERLRAVPGLTHAAACSAPPLSGRFNGQGFLIEGQPPQQPGQDPVGNLRVITPGYFATMEIPLLNGRDFSAADSATSTKVIIIDTAFARRYFPDQNPIGQHLRWSRAPADATMEIIGVAADVKHSSIDRAPQPGFYVPYAQAPRRNMSIVLRTTAADPLSVLGGVRQALRELDPTLPIYRALSMRDRIGELYWMNLFLGRLLVGFAVLAVVLAAVGIAGVVAYAVAQRTHELGVRMALGAQANDLFRLVIGHGMRLVAIGLAFGLLASVALTQALGHQLVGIGWLDPLTLGTSGAVFLAVAFVACWLPARRATRINPVEALRAE